MFLDSLTVIAPTGATVLLGVPSYDAAGALFGFLLDEVDLDPAPLVVYKDERVFSTGGLVTPGRRGAREITVKGEVWARDRVELNTLRRQLVEVLGDFGDDLVEVRFTPENTEVALLGTVEGAPSFKHLGGFVYSFDFRMVCPDPVAYALTPSSQALSPAGESCPMPGNAEVFPTFTITVASGVPTGIRLSNVISGRKLELANLEALSTGDVIVVEASTAYEGTIKAGDGSNLRGKKVAGTLFLSLEPGPNTLAAVVTTGTGTLSVVASWRNGWVS